MTFKGAWPYGKAGLGRPGVEPHLLTNPADDQQFHSDAVAAVHPFITPATLAAALRSRYPRIAVHVRELVHEPFVVWYVYRDGRWLRHDAGGPVGEGTGPRRGGPEGHL